MDDAYKSIGGIGITMYSICDVYLIKHTSIKLSNAWFNRHELNVNSNVVQILKVKKIKNVSYDEINLG